MRLADRIAQCRTPFVVQDPKSGAVTHLTNAAAFAHDIERCATRYVLSDDLTRLCTALAYSKGAATLDCTDLLHVPARSLWIEWTEAPWRRELASYGFKEPEVCSGRRGVLVQSNRDGRQGVMKTFWTLGDSETEVLASSMEAHFDFDAEESDAPGGFDPQEGRSFGVSDGDAAKADILRRCFRFRFERSWQDYYDRGALTAVQSAAVAHHALGTIAVDIPMVLAFFLLLSIRPNLPRRPLMLERLNRARWRSGKVALLDQVEVFAPVVPEYRPPVSGVSVLGRRASRLHHVRGHLVRRGSQIFWRVPHLRGHACAGAVRTRTVTWTSEASQMRRGPAQSVASGGQ